MKKIFLSIIVGLTTLALVEAAETQTQPEPGKPAPDFSLATGDGSQVSLKDYRGKWIVLYFYPKDFTSGCTMEARNFQRDLAKYEGVGAVILGVSV
ncbi:MAG: peroxiredoxin, partial [Verrucomicrobia bacterium]